MIVCWCAVADHRQLWINMRWRTATGEFIAKYTTHISLTYYTLTRPKCETESGAVWRSMTRRETGGVTRSTSKIRHV